MSEITYSKYWQEVQGTAHTIAFDALNEHDNDRERALEYIYDSLLHETIDGHHYIIYYANNLKVIEFSENKDYIHEVYCNEAIGQLLADKGLDGLFTVIAFYAFMQDVTEKIESELDEILDNREE